MSHDELRTRRYRRWRRGYLTRHPLCIRCAVRGRTCAATDVDHIVQRADGGALMDFTNVRALCRACHLDRHRGRWSAEDHALRSEPGPGPEPEPEPEPRASADVRAVRAREADAAEVDAVERERDRWRRFARETD